MCKNDRRPESRLCKGGVRFEFRAYDLRRTAASYMGETGVDRFHIAHVLNHRSVPLRVRARRKRRCAARLNDGSGGLQRCAKNAQSWRRQDALLKHVSGVAHPPRDHYAGQTTPADVVRLPMQVIAASAPAVSCSAASNVSFPAASCCTHAKNERSNTTNSHRVHPPLS